MFPRNPIAGAAPINEMARLYPTKKNQAQIIRSLVLFTFLLGKTDAVFSLTSWVNDVLPSKPVFIALVSCRTACDLPSPDNSIPFGENIPYRLWREKKTAS